MDTQIVAVYCLCDDLLKALYHSEDPQCQISDAEVMTTAITAMLYFSGNYEIARRFYGIWLCSSDVGKKPVQSSSASHS